ncbi:efflux RND transporter permease subunit [Acetobacter orleanensis]|uniref:Transport system membrane protein n=1 Tax=Acetobacter orleanensis TaxID=104099 RepID=A0A4Y3TIT4_9PROT|nr:efflux RND transporter permease subunit [Acetobacter orleanensis]KXV62154.1 nodulation protein [Acetobacter orleanensis]PCD80499.1 nodulation protein [Acetobacter orleanensis]GAN67415.1 multidrug resistance efflux pump acriflavin resistance protein [Acetobacter orleanensis JCM 7639]GBR26747.1 multidrug efflux pump acriflavin resistance protein AcrB/AcrD/AcrF [Acetobacter orleanensis NRIC 0473]GEB81872.1 transport system membrane protein [Acetobacter orleanensis]
MNFSRIFIDRPVATILLTVALLLAGVLGYSRLPVSDLPNVDFPVIQVMARQAGGSPSEIASTVAAPLERHLGQIADLTEMTSQSSQNVTRITLQFALSRDINGAARDVEAALQAAHADLPSTLRQNPSYSKANPNGAPILILALTSDTHTQPQLYDYATNVLQQQLSQIDGVGEVEISGSALPAVRVEINPHPLYKYGISFEDVRAALASANAHTPKGIVDQNGQRFTLDTNDQARSAQDYRDLLIAWRNNRPVRLSDVAYVRDSVEDLRNAGYYNGSRSVIAVVFPQAGANTIKTVDQINARMPLLRAALPGGVDLHVGLDRSLTIRASLADTQYTLIISILLVVLVVLAFLHSVRMTLIPAVVVPTSIVATFGVMAALGYSLDNMSLMALTVSTGFVVDDAIVVVENIARYIEMGYSARDAAIRGTGEVAFTVISISISLIAVFLPILLLGGLAGRLFHEFAMTVSVTILISMVLSLTLTPMMAAQLLAPHKPGKTPKILQRMTAFITLTLNGLQAGYTRTLDIALTHRKLVLLSLPLTLALIVALFIRMPKGFFPTEDTGMMMGHLMGDQSISFTALTQKLMQVQKIVLKDRDVQSVSSFIGGRGANQANLFLQLKDKSQRTDTPTDLIARITRRMGHLVGAQFFLMQPGAVRAGARQSNAAYQYTLEGESASELYTWTSKLRAVLQHRPEFTDLSSDVQQGGSAIDVQIDRSTSARVQITPQLLSNTLYDAFGQRSASVIYNMLNQYHVVMEADPQYWSSPDALNQVWISVSGGSAGGGTRSNTVRVRRGTSGLNASGNSQFSTQSSQSFKNQIANALAGGAAASNGSAVSTSSETMVPLTLVSKLVPARTPLSINHQGMSVATTISFNLAKGVSLSTATQVLLATQVALHMPPTIHGNFAGNAAQFQQAVNDEPLLVLAALGAVYITLGVLYESYVHPLTILSTLPSAGVGALLALQLAGEEFSLIAMIGVILLIGIVKKNAIMLVDFAIDAERTHNLSSLEAIRTACLLRFRPIMMTSVAAALGAAPLIVANGYGSELRRPLGIAIVGGLIVSQALTLYTTPVIYLVLDRLRLRFARRHPSSPYLTHNLQDT